MSMQKTPINAPRTVAYHFSRRDSFGRVVWDVGHAVHPEAIEWHPLVRQSPPQREPLTDDEIRIGAAEHALHSPRDFKSGVRFAEAAAANDIKEQP